MIILSELWSKSLDILSDFRYCVSLIGGETHERLHESLRRELREQMDRQDREKLLKLVDLGIELREETSLAAFTAGFRLALGIAEELEPYSFEDEEEERACRK